MTKHRLKAKSQAEVIREERDREGQVEVVINPKEPNSIVKDRFKKRYIANAVALGETSKAAKRSNWDWLSQQIAVQCLDEKGKLRVDDFLELLDLNGVDWSRWTNRNKGWEGRLRMTGRVALQRKVLDRGKLVFKMGESLPPVEWIIKNTKLYLYTPTTAL